MREKRQPTDPYQKLEETSQSRKPDLPPTAIAGERLMELTKKISHDERLRKDPGVIQQFNQLCKDSSPKEPLHITEEEKRQATWTRTTNDAKREGVVEVTKIITTSGDPAYCMRNSADPTTILVYNTAEWACFLLGVIDGEFDKDVS